MSKKNKKETGFEKFSQIFLIFTTCIFIFGFTFVKSYEASYNKKIQVLQKQIETTKSEIDDLKMQKQELTTFNRVAEVAQKNGYTYYSSATAFLHKTTKIQLVSTHH